MLPADPDPVPERYRPAVLYPGTGPRYLILWRGGRVGCRAIVAHTAAGARAAWERVLTRHLTRPSHTITVEESGHVRVIAPPPDYAAQYAASAARDEFWDFWTTAVYALHHLRSCEPSVGLPAELRACPRHPWPSAYWDEVDPGDPLHSPGPAACCYWGVAPAPGTSPESIFRARRDAWYAGRPQRAPTRGRPHGPEAAPYAPHRGPVHRLRDPGGQSGLDRQLVDPSGERVDRRGATYFYYQRTASSPALLTPAALSKEVELRLARIADDDEARLEAADIRRALEARADAEAVWGPLPDSPGSP